MTKSTKSQAFSSWAYFIASVAVTVILQLIEFVPGPEGQRALVFMTMVSLAVSLVLLVSAIRATIRESGAKGLDDSLESISKGRTDDSR